MNDYLNEHFSVVQLFTGLGAALYFVVPGKSHFRTWRAVIAGATFGTLFTGHTWEAAMLIVLLFGSLSNASSASKKSQ